MADLLATLRAIKRDVDGRIKYRNDGSLMQLPDATWVTPGSYGEGDCTVFARAYLKGCEAAGIPAYEHTYKLPDGQWHRICIADEKWVLDVRERWVVPVAS